MDLHLPTESLERYKSASQRARIGTEAWGALNFFCSACNSPKLNVAPRNAAAVDYFVLNALRPFSSRANPNRSAQRLSTPPTRK
jgi:hypothetical protein